MQWVEYTIKTVVSEIDKISFILSENGFDSFEIKDDLGISPEDEKRMFTDIPGDVSHSEDVEFVVYSTEEETENKFSTGSSLRDDDLLETFHKTSIEETMKLLENALLEAYSDDASKRPSLSFKVRDDSEWKDKYKESFKAFRVTDDIVIKPMWEERPDFARDDDIVVTINPGAGFGTGMHDTTKLCLTALDSCMKSGDTVLDIGCGSGILGITALLKGAGYGVLMDIDELAIDNVTEDMELNDIKAGTYHAFRADILSETERVRDELEKVGVQKFDVVLANILADVIVLLCDVVRDFIKPGGYFITSGILIEKADEVREALLKNGFEIVKQTESGEWTSFLCKEN